MFRHMLPRITCALLFCCLFACPAASTAEEEEPLNNGQDFTRPLTRFDIRYEYQNAPGSKNDNVNVATLRVDKPIPLSKTWLLATRFDLPLMLTDRKSMDNPRGAHQFGTGDVLAQAMLVHTPSKCFAWALGTQVVFPTATKDEMGTGRYRVVPTVGARWTTDNILRGSWFLIGVRWDKDFASNQSNSTKTNELQFAPTINIPLPGNAFINLFPSADIRYNAGDKRPGDKGRWFVPANAMIGKMVRKNVVTSVEVGVPIIKDYRVYDFKTEFRIGIFF